ncbi:TPA: hypothetical protein ENG04_08510, partial [Candidatus Poribacteria bacterium]|nr:hypothetical protein [Candidatus Poribacteria bacterium]HEX30107.1 hypothetical protein [Candidatus Poribacteria bacterium]
MKNIALTLILVYLSSVAFALDLTVESKTVKQGEVFSLKVMLDNADTLGNTTFHISYPPDKLELLGITPGGVAGIENSLYAVNPELTPSRSGEVRFSWVYGAGYSGGGDLITLQFKIGAVEEREIPIRVESVSAVKANEALEDQEAIGHDGVLTVKFYGDVTDDRRITAFDASKILRHVAEKELLPEEVLPLADVSGQN